LPVFRIRQYFGASNNRITLYINDWHSLLLRLSLPSKLPFHTVLNAPSIVECTDLLLR